MENGFADDDFGELYAADLQLPPIPPPPPQRDNDDCGDASDAAAVANDDYTGTDSDDGLDIVLNDDDCRGCDEDVHGGLDNNGSGEGFEQSKIGSEFVASDGVKSGYGSRFFRSKVSTQFHFLLDSSLKIT